MPRACACSRARVTSEAMPAARSASIDPPSAASRDSTSPPGMYSLTMNGLPASSPVSSTLTTWGWSPSLRIACASRVARAWTAAATPSVSNRATATSRPEAVSSAR